MENDAITKRAYGYTRVSTEEQVADGNSLENQRKAIEKYARAHNIEIMGWYVEEGVSAKTAHRPELEKMLEACRNNRGEIDHIVVYNISRISRNIASYYKEIGAMLAHDGVTLRSTMEPIDETPMGKLMLNISLAFHQFDNDVKGQTSHDNMVGVAANGWWVTQPPVGLVTKRIPIDEYQNDGHQKTRSILIPDTRNDIGKKIATVFNKFAEAGGYMSEADAWRLALKLGITMPRTGKPISFSSFDRMLRRPVYAGYSNSALVGGELKKLRFDGLITLDTFLKVQDILGGKKKEYNPLPNGFYPLKGTFICSKCDGHVLASAPTGGSGKKSPRYHCRCKGHGSMGVVEAHDLFVELLKQITPTDDTVKLFKEIVRRTAARKLGDANKEIKRLKELESNLSDQIEATLHSYLIEKDITKEQMDFFTNRLEKQRQEVRKQQEEQEKAQQISESTIAYICKFIKNPAKLWIDSDFESKRAFQQMLFPNGLHIDLKEKSCGTEDLSPLYSVIGNKNEPNDGSNSPMVTSPRVELGLSG